MPSRVRARYVDGVLQPLEPLELEDGCEVTLEIADQEAPSLERTGNDAVVSNDDAAEPLGNWLLQLVDELHRKYPPDTWDDVPTDFVRNKKHYLYGHPRDDDE